MLASYKAHLIQRIEEKKARIGIVGLGYVGLPLMLRCCETGYDNVIGFDLDHDKIKKLSDGKSYIEHIPHDLILKNSKQFKTTHDFSLAAETDILILCVPTPLNKYREPNLSYIINTMNALRPYLKPGQMISLESTTYPGTTDEELAPRIESCGFTIGENFFLLFSPERIDPGNRHFPAHTIPKVCGGYSPNCLEVGVKFYSSIIDQVVPVSSTRVAELTKILENIHRAVNIGLVNEMKIVADKMGIDIHEAISAAATKPFGFVPYQPGPGLGGHCIPIDPFYLTWKAREYGLHTRFIELAGEINAAMPNYVISKIIFALNTKQKSVNQSRILILGIAYKKNVDDVRESPSIIIMEKLSQLGAQLFYSDPHVPVFSKEHHANFNLSSVPLNSETLKQYDCVIIAADHDLFDYQLIKESSQLIIDCRGRYREKNDCIIHA